ncbi:MAG: hypothetical protein KGK08_00475 [Acidobacteriota bacterium]|nr:hypothetical protein [Acidobacteriota bacterium]
MNRLALMFLLVVPAAVAQAPAPAASTPAAAAAHDLSGKWMVHTSIAGNDNDQTCTLTQKDAVLTGICTSDTGSVKLTGKVEGSKVSWSYQTDYNGTPLTLHFTGTLDAAGKMSGTTTVDPFGVDGDFTAEPTK